MADLIHGFILERAASDPDAVALSHRGEPMSYASLATETLRCAAGLMRLGLEPSTRVATFLPKRLEAVIGLFGAAAAGGVFVPINPLLKPRQVGHIVRDCEVRVIVTSLDRAEMLATELADCPSVETLILVDAGENPDLDTTITVRRWEEFLDEDPEGASFHRRIDHDMAAIMYTSGSTGLAKGVVLSHRNMVAGAQSVASYLENRADDRILAALSLSFDAGLSQLTTAFSVGASVTLMEYLLPRDLIRTVARESITGLGAVPPLWIQLADLEWPEEAVQSLRYITNTGGKMPVPVTRKLKERLPRTDVYLMYGLTEAFRSTYLPPSEVERRPDSIGKGIPNAEILVVGDDGRICGPDEPGELVHRGAQVSLGYWNNPKATAERFKPAPGAVEGLVMPEMAVWSGDTVVRDEEGFLYFVARRDEMIKTSGFRVSPQEVEEAVHESGLVVDCAAIGVPHPSLGSSIVLIAAPARDDVDAETIVAACRASLPNYMVPGEVLLRSELPKNPNGKTDRAGLRDELLARQASGAGETE